VNAIPVSYVEGSMGSGKTLYATLKAIDYNERFPNNKIYANYKIKNIKNFEYTPFCFIPYYSIENCLFIIDDVYSVQNLNGLTAVIVNLSRKKNIEVVITCQYYTQVPKKIRDVSDFLIKPVYIKNSDTLLVNYIGYNFSYQRIVINAVERAKKYYDTNEVVNFLTDSRLEQEILKYSNTLDELEINLTLVEGDKRKRKSLYNRLKDKIKN